MKIRQVMDCVFTICSHRETIFSVTNTLLQQMVSYVVVVDNRNKYKGIVTADSLIAHKGSKDQPISTLVKEVTPVMENDRILTLKNIEYDIIPVINTEGNVAGIVSLKTLVEYLPDIVCTCDKQNIKNGKKDNQYNSKYTIDDIVGVSNNILQLKERIISAAKTKSTVLIMGETGTGKELVAHAIHKLSPRRHQPFIRINCAAIPESLLESELFGYEQGAFTGANKSGHPGKFQMADGGTIFLDEIGDMPFSLQSKILRVLQEREIEKIGGRFPIPVDVRVIAATHCDLLELVKQKKFRQDLYFRLHVIPIHIPSLRMHREDIPILVEHYINKIGVELEIENIKVEEDFISSFMDYQWPGNVRELVNVIEMAMTLSNGNLTSDMVPSYISNTEDEFKNDEETSDLRSFADEAEREAILKSLEAYRGNKIKVAEALGISRSSLYYKLKKYYIDA